MAGDPSKAIFLELAELRTNPSFYGVYTQMAIALRAAHMLTMTKRATGEPGAVTSKSEGDLSISYVAGAGQGIEDLDQTHYGKQLKDLIRSSGSFLGVTGGNI